MCGLAGFIGQSRNPKLSNAIISGLFEKIESRGTDASGFYACDSKSDSVFYEKQPIRSSDFVKHENWLNLLNNDLDCILVHARKTTKGSGAAWCNSNNHPFVSFDKSLALIHNGKISNDECEYLKSIYDTISECDSEFLLRIIESASDIFKGILNIFSLINSGHMAVAVAQKVDACKNLWLFRNSHRPLWVVDLRQCLNQIFFISEKRIWDSVVHNLDSSILINQFIMELPENEVWNFQSNYDNLNFSKHKIIKANVLEKDLLQDERKKIPINQAKFNLVSSLNEQDELFAFYMKKLSFLNGEVQKNQIIEFIKDKKIL